MDGVSLLDVYEASVWRSIRVWEDSVPGDNVSAKALPTASAGLRFAYAVSVPSRPKPVPKARVGCASASG